MAAGALPLCSPLRTAASATFSRNRTPASVSLSLSRTGLSSVFPIAPAFSLCRPTFSPIDPSRPTFLPTPKFSVSEAPPVESEPETPAAEPTAVAGTAIQRPEREEIFAVVMIGGRQYIVFPGRYIYSQRLKDANVNDKITLNKVLLVGTRTSTWIGKPVVPNAVVHAVVEEQGLNPKVIVFKYKRKKNYRRNIGHRQPNTRIRITGITGYQDSPCVTLDS